MHFFKKELRAFCGEIKGENRNIVAKNIAVRFVMSVGQ